MTFNRKSGVLLHISSLPSAHGIGDFGKEAYSLIDQLKSNGFSTWQILPLNPVGPGNSPYQAYSTYAGESLFISLEMLVDWQLLSQDDIKSCPDFPKRKVDYNKVHIFKDNLLSKAWLNFQRHSDVSFQQEFTQFKEEHNWWMSDYALYSCCKKAFKGTAWNQWEIGLMKRDLSVLQKYTVKFSQQIEYIKFVQFMFYRQWFRLKEYANEKGITIFGDLPLYVSHDSSDVWGNQKLFLLDENGDSEKIGGVPPDYFSEEGQLWGNPVFNWNQLAASNYHWWISRLHFNLHLFNQVRIDHFRGLESFWAVPKGSKTAKIGEWMPAKGFEMLTLLKKQIKELPIVAEDLGIITPEVERLRDAFNLPGMKVLQFAYTSDVTNEHLPHNFKGRNVVYTGTHDNNTIVGWLENVQNDEKLLIQKYFDFKAAKSARQLIEHAWSSTAELAIIPMQDVLNLNEDSRMNVPGMAHGNWVWRYEKEQLKPKHLNYLKELNEKYNRRNE